MTPFGAILKQTVQASPTAIGGAFAASDGEMVDSFATMDPHDWAVLTAHYGIVLSQLVSAFGIFTFGSPEYFIAQHAKLDIIVHAVDAGYFALLAFSKPTDLSIALEQMQAACTKLKKEMA